MKTQALLVGWPSFLMAGALEMLVFSVADSGEFRGFGGALAALSPTALRRSRFRHWPTPRRPGRR